jgi:hypothetical protein
VRLYRAEHTDAGEGNLSDTTCPACAGAPAAGTYCPECGLYVAEQVQPIPYIDHLADGSVPWVIRVQHGMHPWLRVLRTRARVRHGGFNVTDQDRATVRELEEFLDAAGCVIDYDQARGIVTVPRDPALDAPDRIVRLPADHPLRLRRDEA